jgi:hypothetical protein
LHQTSERFRVTGPSKYTEKLVSAYSNDDIRKLLAVSNQEESEVVQYSRHMPGGRLQDLYRHYIDLRVQSWVTATIAALLPW